MCFIPSHSPPHVVATVATVAEKKWNEKMLDDPPTLLWLAVHYSRVVPQGQPEVIRNLIGHLFLPSGSTFWIHLIVQVFLS